MKANWLTAIITALCLLLSRFGSDSIQGRGQENIAGKEPVPSYLKGYEKLYEKDPHAAAVEWFKDAKFGLFVHYALASLLEEGKWEYAMLIEKEGPDNVNKKLFHEFKAEKFDADRICPTFDC